VSTVEPTGTDRAQLRWQCRRGLLELDLLFDTFLDHGYLELDDRQRQLFRQLLRLPDPQLQTWLMGQATAEQPYIGLIARIRAASAAQARCTETGPGQTGREPGQDQPPGSGS
jgi:antitoxin CptB